MPSPLRQPCFSAATSFTLIFRKEYSLDELKQKPAPDGVDPSRLEAYLNEADFQVKKKNIFFCLHFYILYQLVRYGSQTVDSAACKSIFVDIFCYCRCFVVVVVFGMKYREGFGENPRAPRWSRAEFAYSATEHE